MVNKIIRGGLMALALAGAAGIVGCENTRVVDKERERQECINRSNYELTQHINHMLVFDASSKSKHRMLYGEFLKVTGVERKLSAKYDALPVRVDINPLRFVDQELGKDDDGKVVIVYFKVPREDAGDVSSKLAQYLFEGDKK